MHGIVLKGLKDFVVESYDQGAWAEIQAEASLDGKIYVPVTEYPDEDVQALVGAAAEVTGREPADLLEAFGRFLVPPLLETYGVHVSEDWTGLELVANVEEYIHTALREKELSAYTPPELRSEWVGEDRVGIVYTSDRELCPLARGLIYGVGEYFEEPLEIDEQVCMKAGDDRCEMVVSAR